MIEYSIYLNIIYLNSYSDYFITKIKFTVALKLFCDFSVPGQQDQSLYNLHYKKIMCNMNIKKKTYVNVLNLFNTCEMLPSVENFSSSLPVISNWEIV